MDADTIRRLIEFFNIKQFFTDNSPLKLSIILGIMCLLFIAAQFICAFVQKKLEKYVSGKTKSRKQTSGTVHAPTDLMDFELFEKVIKNTRRILYLMIIYWGLDRIIVGPVYEEVIRVIFVSLCTWAIIEFFTAFVPFNIDLYLRKKNATLKTSQNRALMPIIKGLIWAIGLTFLLDNLGFHVSTIIAGLGIVGVAVGLAGQAILADFFSYIVILLDKPFRIGDYVEIGDGKAGDVEYMGPKTTHLRNLADDLIVCANSEMTRGILVNQGSIHEREVIVEIGVSYNTPVSLLKKMPDILREVVNSFPQCSFDRACLLSFGPSNLLFQLLYMVSPQKGGIRDFMITRSDVNIAILERFANEGITLDYPSENVYLKDVSPRPTSTKAESVEINAPDNN